MGSILSCCPNFPIKQDNVKISIVSQVTPANSLSTASTQTLSSTIQSKDFFNNIENAAFTPINRTTYRRASLSNISIPTNHMYTISGRSSQNSSQFINNNSIYQNLPSQKGHLSTLPTRPQTALPSTGSVFVFPDIPDALQVPRGDSPEYVNLAKDVPAVKQVQDQRTAYMNAVAAVHGQRYNRRSRIGSESCDSRQVVTYVRPNRRHSAADMI